MVTKKKSTEIVKEEKHLLDEFKQYPLENILKVIIRDHTGTEREQKTALTGLLYILRIMALKDRSGILKVTGKSSAGKSHLVKTLLTLLPNEWIKEIGDATGKAIRYMQWKQERILYIKEGSGGDSSTETLKLMDSGDGGFKFIVTRGSVSEGFYTEEIDVPVKFIITTSAKDIFDNELDNRMFGISIDESDEQTQLILLHRCRFFAGHLSETYFGIAKKFISELQEFDEIRVPYSYEFLNIINRNIRARRDIDKLLSLCQTSAFINQHNRPKVTTDGKTILFATPEDAYNVFSISLSSFEETTTGFTSRMEQIFNVIPAGTSVNYREIMKATKTPYKQQVKREVEKLEDLGLVEIDTSSSTHSITRLDDIKKMKRDFEHHKRNFLVYTLLDCALHQCDDAIPLSWIDIIDHIKCNKNRNILSQKIEPLQENRNKNRNKGVTKPKIFYTNDELEQYFGDGKNVKTVTSCYGHVTVNVTPSQQEKNEVKTAKCNIVTQSKGKQEKTPIIDLRINVDSFSSRYDVTASFFDQKDDLLKLFNHVKLNDEQCFEWDDALKDFITKDLGKEDPDLWINKHIENGVMAEPILGKLKFLVNIEGDNQ